MLLFAAAAIDKVKTLPPETWVKIGIAVVCLIVAVFVIRKIMDANKLIAGVLVFIVGTVVFFSWVYNRNEPKFLTPIVEQIAPFFPSGRNLTPTKADPKTAPKSDPKAAPPRK